MNRFFISVLEFMRQVRKMKEKNYSGTIFTFYTQAFLSIVNGHTCADPEGRQGVRTPPEKSQKWGFLAIPVRIP